MGIWDIIASGSGLGHTTIPSIDGGFLKSKVTKMESNCFRRSPVDEMTDEALMEITSYILKKLLGKGDEDKKKKNEVSVSNKEIKHVLKLIEAGRKQGLKELEIEVSKDFSDSMDQSAGIPTEMGPIGLSFKISKKRDGRFILKVKYMELGAAEKLKQLSELHKEGVLTDSEYKAAKKKVIEKM